MPQSATAPRPALPRFVYDWPPEWQERFAERAGIMEFMGNLPRHMAEENAERDTRIQFNNEQVGK